MTVPTASGAAPAALPRLVSVREVADWLGVSRQAIHRAINEGRLPKPITIGKSCVRFVESELRAHLGVQAGAA
jgi:excisionase family DNA binding protein